MQLKVSSEEGKVSSRRIERRSARVGEREDFLAQMKEL